jgi:iron complex outermembrane recepter protein
MQSCHNEFQIQWRREMKFMIYRPTLLPGRYNNNKPEGTIMNMKKAELKDFKHNMLAVSVATISIILTLGSSTAVGQAQPAQQGQQLEEITVTGSRIVQTSGMASPVPVTVISAEELFNFEPGGTVAQQLDALPQFLNNGSAQRGSSGSAAVGSGGPGALNLRGLNVATTEAGISRTLTLLDGARVVPTDKRNNVNVDLLPTALMRTVDVVTGGASAAYGADALGGVVNFILDREFEGLKVSMSTGLNEYKGTGKQWEFSIAGGIPIGDRLHLIGSFETRQFDEIQPDAERWESTLERWGYVTNPAWATAAALPAGNTNKCVAGAYCAAGPQRLSSSRVVSTNDSPTGLIRGTNTSLDWMQFNLAGTALVPYNLGTLYALPGATGSTATLVGGPENATADIVAVGGPTGNEALTRTGFTGLQYDITPSLTGFAYAMVGRTESGDTNTDLQTQYSFSSNFAPLIAVDNYYLPESVKQVMRSRNLTQIAVNKGSARFPGRTEMGANYFARNVFTQYQGSVGFDWEFYPEWNLRTSWQRGQSKRNSQGYDHTQVDRAYLGMDVVAHPVTGKPVCRVSLFNPTAAQLQAAVAGRFSKRPIDPTKPSTIPGNAPPLTSPVEPEAITTCVPYNILGSGNMSQEAVDWIGTDKFIVGYVDQDFAEMLFTGDLYEGWGAGPIGFAGGLTWREQSINNNTLPYATDLLGPPINAPSIGIRGIPASIISGGPNLNLNSTAITIAGQMDVWEWFAETSVPVWEFSGGQSIVADFAVRRSDYNRTGQVDSWKIGTDLQLHEDLRVRITRSQDVREPSFQELFDAQGSSATIQDPARNGESYTITQTRGGNPNLAPEIAKTNTVGFVYQPSFADWVGGLSLSVDVYDVNIGDAVAQLGTQRIVDGCYAGNQALCSTIIREQGGRVGMIFDTFQNVAGARARGIDYELGWRRDVNFLANHAESFNVRWLTGYVTERSDSPVGSPKFDAAGGPGVPQIASTLSINYTVDAWAFQMQTRYVDSVLRNVTWVEGIEVDDNTVASMTWISGRIGYTGELDSGSTWSMGFNVQNILDREPPLFATTNANSYDSYGRRYNLSANFNW